MSLVNLTEAETHTLLSMDDGKANAFSFAMIDALEAELEKADKLGKPVVVRGRPGRFSAGFDLSAMGKQDADSQRLLRRGADLSVRLMNFDLPVIGAISGHALAMGALFCVSVDYRIGVAGDFKIGLNEVAIGMTLPYFGIELCRERLASQHFNAACELARVYNPTQAAAVGFLDEAVAPEQFESRINEVAGEFAKLDMPSHRNTKWRARSVFYERMDAALRQDFS